MTTSASTTTYPYSYTTFTNASPTPFTTPTAIPSMFPWGGIPSSACPAPSGAPSSPDAPLERPDGSSGGCAISNVDSVSDHSFWDMYECCKGGRMSTLGTPLPCTSVCYASDQLSFLELGECLSKRVKVVVCSPPENERGEPKSSSSSSATKTNIATSSGSSQATVTAAKGAASTVAGGQSVASKAGLVVFGLMAFVSAAGMLL